MNENKYSIILLSIMLDVIIDEIKSINTDPAAIPWVSDFLDGLLSPDTDPNLRHLLVSIGCSTFNTTFIDDYGYSPDGLGLSELKGKPQELVEKCLSKVLYKGRMFASEYVEEFARQTNFEPLSSILRTFMEYREARKAF